MSFSKEYAALEREFKAMVKEDNEKCGLKSTYLRNFVPEAHADFVLIAMEPSGSPIEFDPNARNFAYSMEDFILHFCVKNYLCKGTETYHLTDLSKGMLPANVAKGGSKERWERWYPLLRKELKLVAKKDAPIIAIGGQVEGFLKEKKKPILAGRVLHYSLSAIGHWKHTPCQHPDLYKEFAPTVSFDDIKKTVKEVFSPSDLNFHVEPTLKRLKRGSGLTDSRKHLMFTYMVRFAEIREQAGLG